MAAVIDLETARRPMLRLGEPGIALAMALAATALTLALNAGEIAETMRGGFGDPDDAMRLVEARSWLAGQPWFDMNAARLDPPHGSILHWSRLVDLPVAVLIRGFGLFANPTTAERLAAVAVPTLWLLALYLGMMRLAVLLVGREGRVPALIGTFLSGATLVQFAPGRIGHHAPETVALVLAVGAAVAALDARHVRQAFACGVLVAAALAMSLQTLPFLVVLAGTLLALWVWSGPEAARLLGWFAAGLLAALPVLFVLTVGPDRWLASTCDAYGAAHLGAGVVGAAGALVLAALTPRIDSRIARVVGAGLVGTLTLAYVALAYPACLHSPFAGVDPLVRTLWLDHVVESQPLLSFLAIRPLVGTAIIAPIVLGLTGAFVAVARLRDVSARRFGLVAALSATGLALAFWQVRVLGSATPLALYGGIYLASRLPLRRPWIAILPFCSTVWLLALPADSTTPDAAKASAATAACLSPEAFKPFATLAPGSAVAPIDSGSHLLEATSLSVFAAPYHRNDDGNRFAFEVFLAAPDAAAERLAERHVDYVVTCAGMSDLRRLAERAPDGLAARLASGRIPTFLVRQVLAGTPYEVYRVQAAK